MNLSEWTKYRDLLKNINEKAADVFRDAVWNVNGRWKGVGLGQIPRDELIDYAYALATKYGEASAAVSAEMFDKTAFIQQAAAFEAIPAETATYNEVAKTVNGVLKTSQNVNEMAGAISSPPTSSSTPPSATNGRPRSFTHSRIVNSRGLPVCGLVISWYELW